MYLNATLDNICAPKKKNQLKNQEANKNNDMTKKVGTKNQEKIRKLN